MAAEAFGQNAPGASGGTGTDEKITIYELKDGTKITVPAKGMWIDSDIRGDIRKKLKQVREEQLPDECFGVDGVKAAKAIIKTYIAALSPSEKKQKSNVPFPLDLSIKIKGAEGFRFGDHIATNYLPAVYKGVGLGFTVLNVIHTFSKDTFGWTTELKTICRLTGK
jgi:hypothetical protein